MLVIDKILLYLYFVKYKAHKFLVIVLSTLSNLASRNNALSKLGWKPDFALTK